MLMPVSKWLVRSAALCPLMIFVGAEDLPLEARFDASVRPFVEKYCLDCHGGERPKADFDMSGYRTMRMVVDEFGHWEQVLEKLETAEMPPSKTKLQPSDDLRARMIDWIRQVRRVESERNAGDPGAVAVRRLSVAEYDYTIRDLTGVDIRPTREFPVDPANEAGFDNSSESLTMSPALLKKYIEAARRVSEFLVFKPEGLGFAPHPVVAETDRDRYGVRRIIEFYEQQPTDYADYFLAAWKLAHRKELGAATVSVAETAIREGISPKYLETIWTLLNEPGADTGPVGALKALWRALPAPGNQGMEQVRLGCEQMRDFVVSLRGRLVPEVANLQAPQVHPGSQPLVLWKNRQFAANRRRYSGGALGIDWSAEAELLGDSEGTNSGDTGNEEDPALVPGKTWLTSGGRAPGRAGRIPLASRLPIARKGGVGGPAPYPLRTLSMSAFEAMNVPEDPGLRERYEAAFSRFCDVFPDAFYVSERARVYLDPEKEKGLKGRLLSAGFHSMTGYFRDDQPLYDLLLNADEKKQLDRLWEEFEFFSAVPMRMHTSFIWFERSDSRFMMSPEFHFARSEDKDATSEEKIRQLASVYLNKVRENGAGKIAVEAIGEHFERVNQKVRRVEREHRESEATHVQALQGIARKAYRRPLTRVEVDELLEFYLSRRSDAGLDHEEAVRETVVSILVSPHFCYRVDLAGLGDGQNEPATSVPAMVALRASGVGESGRVGSSGAGAARAEGVEVSALSDYALASRLSYFLWASMPDDALLARAAAGDLHRPEVLVTEARRLLRDDRARGLVTEFGGNWLDFRRFEEHNAVDRERFPEFDNDLRQAMFEEPIQFLLNLVRDDRPVLDLLFGDYTFVNPVLARHYQIPDFDDSLGGWQRIDQSGRFGRGGLLPMGVFLTKNAPGLRTSPVKRGYWVVRRLLGERIPPPPPNVPELPSDEGKLGGLTLREVLARHRDHESCAGCHERFDAMGLVFEGFGPVGERRTLDLGGRPVDTRAAFPDGGEGQGVAGLRDYLRERRLAEFLDNLCRKLLAYGLGRNLMLSDDPAIEEMKTSLENNGYRFSVLVEKIVTSRQFLNKRSRVGIADPSADQSSNLSPGKGVATR